MPKSPERNSKISFGVCSIPKSFSFANEHSQLNGFWPKTVTSVTMPSRFDRRSYACQGFEASAWSRRDLLKVGGLGLLGLTLPHLLQAEAKRTGAAPKPRTRSVIFLYQFGGPSHIDMFDMKPDAPEAIEGCTSRSPQRRTDLRLASGCRVSPGSWIKSRSSAP